MKDGNDFSFLKLRDEMIKLGVNQNFQPTKEEHKKLKFEPNLNIVRHPVYHEKEKNSELKKNEELHELTPVNLNQISSRFSNRDSLNVNAKRSTSKKDKKTIVITSDKLLEPEKPNEEKKDKKLLLEETDLKTVIKNLRVKDPTGYLPTTIPFKSSEEEEDPSKIAAREILNENGSLNESDIFLLQFPRMIPVNSEIQNKLKAEEVETEEPIYDQNGFLVKNDFENVFKEFPRNSQMGKLKIFKSGKIKLQLGNNLYEVSTGVNCKFAQELGVVSTKSQEAFFLGKIRDKKLIVTPELNLK